MKKTGKRMIALLCTAALMLCTGCSKETAGDTAVTEIQNAEGKVTESVAAETEGNNLTSLEVISLMGNGINLGNTLEAYNHQGYLGGADPTNFETSWGQPKTTPEIIQGMKDAGFDTLRIPVAWTNGMNFESGDYTIDERLMNRVEEVVNYALDADMYVIINDHWDGGWWGMFGSADMEVREKGMELYKSMWSQIGERFKDYSYKLIFESANEELGDRLNDKEITGSKGVLSQDECYEKLYEINSEFVKLIRSTGGNNADRFLLIAGYNTDITMTCDERYKMPEDTAKDKLLLSVHYYTPWDYCGTEAVNQWGSPDDFDEQNELLKELSKFNEQGYGVVIGEYAVQTKSVTKPDTDKFYNNFLDNCDYYEFCPVLWDCSTLYKRHTLKMSDENIAGIFDTRRLANENGKTRDEIKAAAKESIDAAYKAAEEEIMAGIEVLPSDDKAAAWIMFQSGDWSIAYSVGDRYDPTNMSAGVKATNVEVTGEGTYTVSLDFTELGGVSGTAFSALGIYNGEKLFPGYIIDIESILVNGEEYELAGKEYTTSDDGNCTRVNLYNEWVTKVPEDARTADGDVSACSAQIMPLKGNDKIDTLTINFAYIAP